MDIAAINRLLKSHCNLKSQEKKEFRLQAGLLEISNFNPPIKIIKPKPYKKPIPANSAMNTHFNKMNFEERQKFIQEIATERHKKKYGLD
ncbi:MAG: hypothetical protein ACJATE_000811 [Bacteroidia bacterium]|jgi:hypothetical protein